MPGDTTDRRERGFGKAAFLDGRTLRQYLVLAPLWLLFFWGWYLVLFRRPLSDLVGSFRLLAIVGLIWGIAVTLWIRHNIRIYREKGPRRNVRFVTPDYTHDVLGKPVALTDNAVRGSHVLVTLEGGTKFYRCAPAAGVPQLPDSDQLSRVGINQSR